jgi:hypothetical protein
MEVLRYTRGSSLAMESSSLRKLVHLTRDTSYTAVHCLVLATAELHSFLQSFIGKPKSCYIF